MIRSFLFLLCFFSSSILWAKEANSLENLSREMAHAAEAFLESLDQSQQAKAVFDFTSSEREAWGYVPRARKGLAMEALNDSQIEKLRKLLKTVLSEPGLMKVDTIIALEAFLAEIEKNPEFRNSKAYFTSVFGRPSPSGTWAWRFEGHHLSLNYTIIDGKTLTATPSFFAANPGEIKIEHAMKGTRPFHQEEDFARDLALDLEKSGKSVIFSKEPPQEILTAEKRKWEQLDAVGIKATELSTSQKASLRNLIAVYARRHREALAEKDLAEIDADFDALHFAWAGSLQRGEPYYYRIQGTKFLIEVANVQNQGNHFHAVWRDLSNDFGRDLLSDHLLDHH